MCATDPIASVTDNDIGFRITNWKVDVSVVVTVCGLCPGCADATRECGWG